MKMTLDANDPNMLAVESWLAKDPEAALAFINRTLAAAKVIWPRQLARYQIGISDEFRISYGGSDAGLKVHEESGHAETQTDVEPRGKVDAR